MDGSEVGKVGKQNPQSNIISTTAYHIIWNKVLISYATTTGVSQLGRQVGRQVGNLLPFLPPRSRFPLIPPLFFSRHQSQCSCTVFFVFFFAAACGALQVSTVVHIIYNIYLFTGILVVWLQKDPDATGQGSTWKRSCLSAQSRLIVVYCIYYTVVCGLLRHIHLDRFRLWPQGHINPPGYLHILTRLANQI